MKASDFMVRQVIKVLEEDTVRSVMDKFVANRISGLPVVNHRNEIVGYISDGDIMRRIGKQNPVVFESFLFSAVYTDQVDIGIKFHKLIEMNVMKVATHHVITVEEDTEIGEIAAILGKKRIKKVPVVKNGVLAGIISRGDIIRAVTRHYLTQSGQDLLPEE
ncbi:CBS domain-containing protein [Gorillibacterium sp. sgz5001074]|uniref:CBS domain-containing protein n=1 Tax=Gorillibacterium sp. sgz5001074 TaxID=3446695 RepID=UPI003F6788F7